MKKLMAAVMCMALGMAVLAGCGNKAAETSATSTPESSSVVVAADTSATSSVADSQMETSEAAK